MERHVRVAVAHMESYIDDLMEIRAMTIATANDPKEVEEYLDKFIEKKLDEYKEVYKDKTSQDILFNALGRLGIKVE